MTGKERLAAHRVLVRAGQLLEEVQHREALLHAEIDEAELHLAFGDDEAQILAAVHDAEQFLRSAVR